jgi:cell division protein FtsL
VKDSTLKGIIAILVFVIVGLSLLLIQNQRTIKDQQVTIAAQQKQIDDLNAKVAELSAVTPEALINDAKSLLRNQGASFLNDFIQRVQQ